MHWRLRVVEQVNGTLQLVHEIASPDDFDLSWSGTGSQGGTGVSLASRDALSGLVKFRVVPHAARIEATPVLHRPGSPGALATARQFGFLGHLCVEEVILRAGEEIVAEGILEGNPEEPWDVPAGPFRGVERELELFEATVRLPARAALAPVLLPWALGTAAALLGGVGVAAWAARRFDLLPDMNQRMAPPTAQIGPLIHTRRHYSRPE